MELKNVCKLVSKVILVLGIIGSFFLAYSSGLIVDISSRSSSYDLERNWLLTILIFIFSCFGTFASFLLFHSLGEILDYLDILHTNMKEAIPEAPEADDPAMWVCESCGRKNKPYVGTCSCGQNRR